MLSCQDDWIAFLYCIFHFSSETHASQKPADDPGIAFEALQVHGTVQQAHQSLTPGGFPTRTSPIQYRKSSKNLQGLQGALGDHSLTIILSVVSLTMR